MRKFESGWESKRYTYPSITEMENHIQEMKKEGWQVEILNDYKNPENIYKVEYYKMINAE